MKKTYSCTECGAKHPRWIGKCSICGSWETIAEEKDLVENKKGKITINEGKSEPISINAIKETDFSRINTSIPEFDFLIGGGLVPGSFVLIGGDPGIGKSTLMMQISDSIAKSNKKVLYVSGEESAIQIKGRANRLNSNSDNLIIWAENNLEKVLAKIKDIDPQMLIVDSIQAVYLDSVDSTPGSVSQIRECAATLMKIAKTFGIPVFLVGHVTKEGGIAGPKILEHLVDTVLYFEDSAKGEHRILRVIKNRFGPANEIAIFKMTALGLQEVLNPSEILLSERDSSSSGSIVCSTVEGTRTLLVEVQALVNKMSFNYPQRSTSGVSPKRLTLILAVLEKVLDMPFGSQDIFLNVAGGITIDEPAADAAMALAVLSNYVERPIPEKTIVFGEIGLSGEIRSVNQVEMRIREAQKQGFTTIVMPANNYSKVKKNSSLELVSVKNVQELFAKTLG